MYVREQREDLAISGRLPITMVYGHSFSPQSPRPSPRITAPKMAGAGHSAVQAIPEHLPTVLLPEPARPLRCTLGTASGKRLSRVIEANNSAIFMIAQDHSCSQHGPQPIFSGPLEQGPVQPKVFWPGKAPNVKPAGMGQNRKCPHRP